MFRNLIATMGLAIGMSSVASAQIKFKLPKPNLIPRAAIKSFPRTLPPKPTVSRTPTFRLPVQPRTSFAPPRVIRPATLPQPQTHVFANKAPVISQRLVQLTNRTGKAQRVRVAVPVGRAYRYSGWATVGPNQTATVVLPINGDLIQVGKRYRVYGESSSGRSWGKNFGGLVGTSWISRRYENGRTVLTRYYRFTLQ